MTDATAEGRKRLSLAARILIGLLIGAALGVSLNLLLAPTGGAAPSEGYKSLLWFADKVANPIGQIFLRLLFMVVIPLMFASITLGVAEIGDLRTLGRMGGRALLWTLGTTAIAVAIGVSLVNAFRPGAAVDDEKARMIREQYAGEAAQRTEQAQASGFDLMTFVNIIPKNVVAAAASDRDTLGFIFFSLMLGIAMTFFSRERTQVFRDVLQTLLDLSMKIIGIAMKFAPLGVAGLIFAVTAKLGMSVLLALGYYVLVALAGLAIHQFVVLGILVKVFAGVPAGEF